MYTMFPNCKSKKIDDLISKAFLTKILNLKLKKPLNSYLINALKKEIINFLSNREIPKLSNYVLLELYDKIHKNCFSEFKINIEVIETNNEKWEATRLLLKHSFNAIQANLPTDPISLRFFFYGQMCASIYNSSNDFFNYANTIKNLTKKRQSLQPKCFNSEEEFQKEIKKVEQEFKYTLHLINTTLKSYDEMWYKQEGNNTFFSSTTPLQNNEPGENKPEIVSIILSNLNLNNN